MIRLSEYGSGCVCSISDATQEQEEEEVVVVVIMKAAQRSVIFRISIGSFIQRHSFFFGFHGDLGALIMLKIRPVITILPLSSSAKVQNVMPE